MRLRKKSPVKKKRTNEKKTKKIDSKTRNRNLSASRTRPDKERCVISVVYLGNTVKIPYDTQIFSSKDKITVFQQHCGGENLLVYSGLHEEGGKYKITVKVVKIFLKLFFKNFRKILFRIA
jgi:hypothetical protein